MEKESNPVLLQNRYELKEEKGSGTFGVTYLATDHGMPSKPDPNPDLIVQEQDAGKLL